jgi:hypothetical protein
MRTEVKTSVSVLVSEVELNGYEIGMTVTVITLNTLAKNCYIVKIIYVWIKCPLVTCKKTFTHFVSVSPCKKITCLASA